MQCCTAYTYLKYYTYHKIFSIYITLIFYNRKNVWSINEVRLVFFSYETTYIQSRPLNSTFPYFLVFLLGPSIQLNYLPIACNDHYWQISIRISGCLFFEITQKLQVQNFSFSRHSTNNLTYLSTYFINALQNVICNATIETNTSFIMIILQHFFTPRVHFSNQC